MAREGKPDLVLGTAGHIDHGKSSLVRRLTGTDPDRLAEEKERGLTIVMGFAQLFLPDGRPMGIVDVPGHEKFIRQMIAGSTGFDVVMLCIAADDGIMPQTLEHIAVLQMLGVRSCVVALTKIDLVDESWLNFVTEDIRECLSTTPFADAPIVPVSSVTGEGCDELLKALQDVSDKVVRFHLGEAMRYPADRIFTIKGAGTVMTGALWSGTASPGDSVEVLPSKKICRIRSIQIHGKSVDTAYAGTRIAINLTGIKANEMEPGDFLIKPGAIEMNDRFDAWFTYLDTAQTNKPFVSGVRVHVDHGAREILGRVVLMDKKKSLNPGESAFAQVRLDEPLAMAYGDHFVIRSYSPVHVAGGGLILQVQPRRRTVLSDGERERLEVLKDTDEQRSVEAEVAFEPDPMTALAIARRIGMDPDRVEKLLNEAVEQGRVVTLEGGVCYYTTQAALDAVIAGIDDALRVFHDENPKEAGVGKDILRRRCNPEVDSNCFDAILSYAASVGTASLADGLVGHPSAQGAVQQAETDAAAAFESKLKSAWMAPVELPVMAQEENVPLAVARKVMAALKDEGRVWRATPDLFFHIDAVNESKEKIAEHLNSGGDGSLGVLREVIGASRKHATPLLESLDAHGFTVRDGSVRRLR